MELVKSHFGDLHYEFFNNIVSAHTKSSYQSDIFQYFSFIKERFPDITGPSEVSMVHVLEYKKFLAAQKYASKTINRKLSCLSNYYQFLCQKGVAVVNHFKVIKRGSSTVETPTEALDDDEVKLFFDYLDSKATTLYRAAVYILLSTGIRRSEVVNIKVKDFVRENGKVFLYVVGKGGKEVVKLIPEFVYKYVQDHINFLKSTGAEVDKDTFVMQLKRRSSCQVITSQSIYMYIKKICLEVNITKRISPHSLRSTYISASLEAGVAPHILQQDVGHSNIETTLGYNKRRKAKTDSPVNSIAFLKRA